MKSWRAIEQIAKLEQRNALRRGKFIGLIHTHVIKSLSEEEKKEFFEYMKRKGMTGKFLVLFVFVSLFVVFFLRSGITGNVIFDSQQTANSISIFFVFAFIVLLVIFIAWRNREKKQEKKFIKHIEIAEKAIK